MEVAQTLSLCPACSAYPAVEILVRVLLDRMLTDLDERLRDLVVLKRKLKALRAEAKEQTRPRQFKTTVWPHIEAVPPDPKPRW